MRANDVVDKNYARSSAKPDIQLKRKKPGGGTFVALARPRGNVIVLDDSEGEQERPAAAYKVRDADKCFVFRRVQGEFSLIQKSRWDGDVVDDDFEEDENYEGCHDGFMPNSTRVSFFTILAFCVMVLKCRSGYHFLT